MRNSRRSFLKESGAVTAAACFGGRRLRAASLSMPIGLQLYSVRDLLPRDFGGTLRKLSAAGYTEVEAAGYFDKSAADWKHAMDGAGLRCISTHHPLATLKPQLGQLIDYAHAIGLEYMICSWAGMHRDPSRKGDLNLDDWRWIADQFNAIGEKVKEAGMTFGYHNHTIEFPSESGVMYFDELLRLTDPKYVSFQMDVGWVVAAGQDPLTWLKKFPQRFPLLHVKDMVKGADGKFTNVVMGKGTIDYHPIFRAATGLKHYFIEQEEFTSDPIDELRQDAEFMRNLSV
jgi:sugar phosphate isomerase/epimerase